MNGPLPAEGPNGGQSLEMQLARCTPAGAPIALRTTALGQVHRELRAARWDRRLARVAAMLLAVGVSSNGLIYRLYPLTPTGWSTRPTPQAIGRLAATVAEATDMETAQQFVRQMAALEGWPAQGEEMEIIQHGFQRPGIPITPQGKDG